MDMIKSGLRSRHHALPIGRLGCLRDGDLDIAKKMYLKARSQLRPDRWTLRLFHEGLQNALTTCIEKHARYLADRARLMVSHAVRREVLQLSYYNFIETHCYLGDEGLVANVDDDLFGAPLLVRLYDFAEGKPTALRPTMKTFKARKPVSVAGTIRQMACFQEFVTEAKRLVDDAVEESLEELDLDADVYNQLVELAERRGPFSAQHWREVQRLVGSLFKDDQEDKKVTTEANDLSERDRTLRMLADERVFGSMAASDTS